MEDPNEKTKDIEYPSDSDSSSNTEENPTIILLKEELEKALAEVENFKDIAKRAQSDLINFKRRADDEKTEQRFSIKSSILLSIITILDDFTLAMDMLPEDTESETWLEGSQIIHRKIEN